MGEGPYVDGRMHGNWVIRYPDGGVDEGPYVDGRMHGNWVIRYADGRVEENLYVDGELATEPVRSTPNRPSYYYCLAFESETNLVWLSEIGDYESPDTYEEDERHLERTARRFIRYLRRNARWGRDGIYAEPFTENDAPATEFMPRCLSEFSVDEALDSRDGFMDEIEAIDFNGVGFNISIVDWPQ